MDKAEIKEAMELTASKQSLMNMGMPATAYLVHDVIPALASALEDANQEIGRAQDAIMRAMNHIRDLAYKLGADEDEANEAVEYLQPFLAALAPAAGTEGKSDG